MRKRVERLMPELEGQFFGFFDQTGLETTMVTRSERGRVIGVCTSPRGI